MGKFQVQLRNAEPTWPEVCACCGDASTHTLPPKRGFLRKQATGHVPYCTHCVQHLEMWEAGSRRANQIAGAGWASGIVLSASIHTPPVGLGLLTVGIAGAVITTRRSRNAARGARGVHCADGAPAVVRIGSGFYFTSETYAVAFARANSERMLTASPVIADQLALPRAIVVTRKDD